MEEEGPFSEDGMVWLTTKLTASLFLALKQMEW